MTNIFLNAQRSFIASLKYSYRILEVCYSLISALTNLDILTNFGYLGVTFTLILTENSKYMLSAPLSTPPVVSVSTTFKLVKQLTP